MGLLNLLYFNYTYNTISQAHCRDNRDNIHQAGLSLFGMAKDFFYVEGSNAYFMEGSALSCLPCRIDEALQFDLVKLVIDLDGGAKTANLQRGAFLPQSVPLVATNFAIRKKKTRCVCTYVNL